MSRATQSILKKDDFVELRHQVFVKNTTTKTDVRPASATTIAEFREKGLVLRMPANACATGHILVLQIVPKTNVVAKPKPPSGKVVLLRKTHQQLSRERADARRQFLAVVIEVMARVTLVQTTEDGQLLVEVAFSEVNEKKWRAFLKSYSNRQDAIHRIVKSVKE